MTTAMWIRSRRIIAIDGSSAFVEGTTRIRRTRSRAGVADGSAPASSFPDSVDAEQVAHVDEPEHVVEVVTDHGEPRVRLHGDLAGRRRA